MLFLMMPLFNMIPERLNLSPTSHCLTRVLLTLPLLPFLLQSKLQLYRRLGHLGIRILDFQRRVFRNNPLLPQRSNPSEQPPRTSLCNL